jgi:hypothetical protein
VSTSLLIESLDAVALAVPRIMELATQEERAAEGFEARLRDVLAALDEAGVDADDQLEEGDAVRSLAAERDQLRDLVEAIREELGLLEVHDDAEVLRELAELKALRAVLAGEGRAVRDALLSAPLIESLDAVALAVPRIMELATQEERAAVVAWIRRVATDARWWGAHEDVYAGVADAIENGEHRREETK